jgi:DNA-binding CsgD family transcriptional regulator
MPYLSQKIHKKAQMNIEKTALTLIEHAYDATLAPAKWQMLIEKFIATLGANSGILRAANYNSGAVGLFSTVGYEPKLKQAYRDHFVHLDMFAPTLKQSAIGEMIHGDTAVPWSQQLKSEFYNDYMRPQGVRYVLGATLARDSQHHLLFGLQRSKQQGDFTQEHLKLIRLVAPHIAKTVQIHRQLHAVTTQKCWALSALNRLKIGVILLDAQGRPEFVNSAANQFMNDCGCIIADDGLLLTNVTETLQLHHLISDAATCAIGRRHRFASSNLMMNNLTVTTPEQSIRIQAIPLPRLLSDQAWNFGASDSCVALFITTANSSFINAHQLVELYGLTPAETKLAILIAEGIDLETAAKRLCVSIQTIRTQLKSIFAKTNVSRQAELVALLLSNLLMESPVE